MDKIEEFIKLIKSKHVSVSVVKPLYEPKPGMWANYCIDNSDEYRLINPDWNIAAGWFYDADVDAMVAHAWVVKRKKHKEITPLDLDSRLYVYSAEVSQWLDNICKKFNKGEIEAGSIHPTYFFENDRWVPYLNGQCLEETA